MFDKCELDKWHERALDFSLGITDLYCSVVLVLQNNSINIDTFFHVERPKDAERMFNAYEENRQMEIIATYRKGHLYER